MKLVRIVAALGLVGLISTAVAAPITVRLEGTISTANFYGQGSPVGVVGSSFSAVYRIELGNAKYVFDQTDAISDTFAASSAIGCRGVVGLNCIWNDGPGSPVITSYTVVTEFGTFGGLPWALGFGDNSGVTMNRGYPSIFPPDGNDLYAAAKLQALYLLSADPALSEFWTETLFQRSWSLQLGSSSNGELFGDVRDFTQTPNLAAADSNYFFFNQFVNQRRSCTTEDCSDPTYGLGSVSFEGFLTAISVPEPTTIALLPMLALALGLARRNRPRKPGGFRQASRAG